MGTTRIRLLYGFILLGWLMAFSLFPAVSTAQTCDPWAGRAVSIQGGIQVLRFNQTSWAPLKPNEQLCFGDTVHVAKNSRAAVLLPNEGLLRLDQNTTVKFPEPEIIKNSLINLIEGVTHFFSRTPRSLKVLTPFVNGNVEGTEFLVKVDSQETQILVFKGKVNAENNFGSLMVIDGQSIVARAAAAPVYKTVVQPRDAVQWALYYPPITDFQSVAILEFDDTAQKSTIRESLAAYKRGDSTTALKVLYVLPKSLQHPGVLTYRAGLHLSVGRVERANDDIEKALTLDPAHSDAMALKAIIAVVQNRKTDALEWARKSSDTAPSSAMGKIALSYAFQAGFDIEAALASMEEAVQADANNALAWARMSELYLSVQELNKSLETAQKAESLNPHIPRTQTVLGFAYLAQIKTKEAQQAFNTAIDIDQAAPLPRLGLGLATIRNGDLQEGRQQIEIATGLDPNNSLIRSYLGKAFYDEKRDRLSGNQLEIAKQLDPNDPTPWFYDAIRKQSINRPVEALDDLQKSIELNNNRAVYRSQLLLDEDLAARSASLARIYNELGFQQLALIQGWKSVNTDQANYSAHRFLADSYAALPRHEVARASELLQSQLLQPLNITPVQPQLSESNHFILDNSGPSEPSLNEFNPLFNRDRNSLLASGVVGENGIWGDEIVVSGVWQKVSYSIGQFHYETDGFRENNDLERNAYNLFLQTSLTPMTSLMVEARYNENEEGDLQLRFPFDDLDMLSLNHRKESNETSMRVGLRHAFSPRSQLISHVTYIDAEEEDRDVFGMTPVEASFDDKGYMIEAQHLFNKKFFNLTSGIGYFESELERTIRFITENTVKPEINHTNFYLYANIDYPQNVTWTVGGSVDLYEDDGTKDRDQFNPKIGLTLTPFTGTTLRAAAFRTLKRSLAGRQTIEPTQVAGFNQFFDDPNGSKAWRYGLAIDQTFSHHIHGGIEYSQRDVVPPITDLRTGAIEDVDWDESQARAYVYWTPHPLFALSAEYLFEEFNREDFHTGTERISELKTHHFPLAANFFHTGGLSAKLTLTYIDQEGVFGTFPGDYRRDDDQFWLLDAALRYRLPKRLGFITLGVQNLLDEDFKFQDMDPAGPTIFPERTVLGKVTLSF